MNIQNQNKIKKQIVIFILLVVFLLSYFFVLEQEKTKRIEKSIVAFQTEYKEFLGKDNPGDMTFIEKLTKSDFLKSTALVNHFESLKTETFKNFEKVYSKELYEYNFIKNQNIKNYDTENIEIFKKLVSNSDELLIKLEDNYNIDDLKKLKEIKTELLSIVKDELEGDKVVVQEFRDAQRNIGTTNEMFNDCFTRQNNVLWKYSSEVSRKFCYELGFNSCSQIFTMTKDKEGKEIVSFNAFTMNNPKKLAKNKPYVDYVSFFADDFKDFDTSVFTDLEKNHTIHPEVYVQEIMGRKVYKYNIIAIPNSYKLSCKIPKYDK